MFFELLWRFAGSSWYGSAKFHLGLISKQVNELLLLQAGNKFYFSNMACTLLWTVALTIALTPYGRCAQGLAAGCNGIRHCTVSLFHYCPPHIVEWLNSPRWTHCWHCTNKWLSLIHCKKSLWLSLTLLGVTLIRTLAHSSLYFCGGRTFHNFYYLVCEEIAFQKTCWIDQ